MATKFGEWWDKNGYKLEFPSHDEFGQAEFVSNIWGEGYQEGYDSALQNVDDINSENRRIFRELKQKLQSLLESRSVKKDLEKFLSFEFFSYRPQE